MKQVTGPGRLLASLGALACLALLSPSVLAAAPLDGAWTFTINIPESSVSANQRTLVVTVVASPRDGALVGKLTVTDANNVTVAGAWRQQGKNVSITYELPCAGTGDNSCATLILKGKIKSGKIRTSQVIVLWDAANNRNPALFDTSNGTFAAQRSQ